MNFRVYFLTSICSLLSLVSTYAAEPTREVININDGWQFYPLSAVDSSEAEYITLPHSWQSQLGDCAKGCSEVNYIRSLDIPERWSDRRLFLRFGGVQRVAEVFVNGSYVGSHKGGFTAFTIEITSKVKFGAKNNIRVVVSNSYRSDMLPISSDMDITGGIYRDVELMVTPQNIISPLHHSSDGVYVVQSSVNKQRVEGVLRCYLSTTTVDHASLAMRIVGPDGYEVDSRMVRATKLSAERAVDIAFEVAHPQLWSPSSPDMYRFEVTLDDGTARDMVVVETGFRDVAVTADNRLAINGERCEVRGVNYAHDRMGCGMATTSSHMEQDFALISDMGANAIRSLSGPHSGALYDLCDREGMLVWVDMPFTRSPISFTDICYFPSVALRNSGFEQLEEIIYQNFNHPSVVMWGLFSLVRQPGEPILDYINELNDMAHATDPSRLTVACSNSDGAINFVTDMIVFRQDVGLYKGHVDDIAVWCNQLKDPRWAAMRYGVCYGEEGNPTHLTQSVERATRGTRHLPERRQTYMHERYAANIEAEGAFWGVWLNNMFDYASYRRPYGLNQSGMVCYDHATQKDAYYLYRAKWNSDAVTLRIANRNLVERSDTLQRLDIYSSTGMPTVVVEGDTVGVRRVARGHYAADSVIIRGRAVVEAFDSLGMASDRVVLRYVNKQL